MFSYNFDSHHKILKIKSTGLKTISDIKDYYRNLQSYSNKGKDLKVLIDARETEMDVKHEELKELFFPLIKAIKSFDSLNEAILLSKPAETAIASLFKIEFTNLDHYSFKIFSTEEAAMYWLNGKKVCLA